MSAESASDQFQDRDHERLQLFAVELEKFGKGLGILYVELAGTCATEFGQMRAATELLADVMAERADVRAFRARDAEVNAGQFEFQQPEVVDVDESRLAFDGPAFARQLVERRALMFDSADHRRHLLDVAPKLREHRLNLRF